MVAEVQAAGHQVALHAIGDRAVEQAQTAVAAALHGQPNTYRHRLEHLSVVTPEMVARFGELGLIPVVPGQYPSCTPFGPPLPAEYGAWEWPWRDLREQNPDLTIAWHSDYPFWSINPFIHLYGFVTRNDVYNGFRVCQPMEWLRDDTLPVAEALSIMTTQSAYALFRETEVGSLVPGKYADLIVVSDNPLTVEPEQLRGLSVLATMVGGVFEYCAPSAAAICPGYVARAPAGLPDYRPPVPVRWLGILALVVVPLGLGTARVWPSVSRATVARVGGWAGLLGSFVWVAAWGLTSGEANSPWMFLILPATGLLAIGVVGLSALGRQTWLDWLGLGLAFLGMLAIGLSFSLGGWFDREEAWMLLVVGLLGHALGLLLSGLVNLKARRLPRLNWLPIVMGLLGGPGPLIAGWLFMEEDLGLYLFLGSYGLGWLVLGALMLWAASSKRSATEK
jgi:hypothetical protein